MSQAVGTLWVLEWGSDPEQDLRESAASCGVRLGGEGAVGGALGAGVLGWSRENADKSGQRGTEEVPREARTPSALGRGQGHPVWSRGRRGPGECLPPLPLSPLFQELCAGSPGVNWGRPEDRSGLAQAPPWGGVGLCRENQASHFI